MGILASCCGRRKKNSEEREPLLGQSSQQDELPPPRSAIDRSVDAYSAINAGKMPSQSQINQVISLCLRSGLLSYQQGAAGGPLSQSGQTLLTSTREVLEAAMEFGTQKNVDDRIQEFLYLTSQLSRDGVPPVKVDVDSLIDASDSGADKAKQIATEVSEDAETLASSLRLVLTHLLTSAAFRVLLSDIVLAIREVTAQVASNVAVVAEQVEVAAHDVEEAAMVTASVEGLKGKARDTMSDVAHVGSKSQGFEAIPEDEMSRVRARATRRVQEVFQQAQENPEDRAALLTILSLCRKYADSASLLASDQSPLGDVNGIAPSVETSPTLSKELEHAKILVERLASNRSLDPILTLLSSTTKDALSTDQSTTEMHDYFQHLSSFFYTALMKPDYVSSSEFALDTEALYDDGKKLLHSEEHASWARDLRKLVDEVSSFMDAIQNDAATSKLLASIQFLRDSIASFTVEASAGIGRSKRKMVNEARKDLVGWLLPKILRSIKSLPMPRVELILGKLECAIDALLLNTATAQKISGYGGTENDETLTQGLLPDRMWMQNWTEFRVDMGSGVSSSSTAERQVTSAARVKAHVDGVKLSASGIGYYVRYKDILIPGLAYSDEGLLSISSGEGVSIDVDLEIRHNEAEKTHLLPDIIVDAFSSPQDDNKATPLFQVHDVRVQIPGLLFSIDESKHFILNKTLLQPLAGPVVRNVAAYVLSSQLRQGLEKMALVGGEVEKEAERIMAARTPSKQTRGAESSHRSALEEDSDEVPSSGDYFKAFLRKAPLLFSSLEPPPPAPDTTTESHTTATMKGIIYTSTTHQTGAHDSDETDHEDTPEGPATPEQEMVIAVGAGPQLFPGKGGPYGEDVPEASLEGGKQVVAEMAGEIGEEGAQAARKSQTVVEDGLRETEENAARLRERMDRAGERREKVMRKEARTGGWRSSAFDI